MSTTHDHGALKRLRARLRRALRISKETVPLTPATVVRLEASEKQPSINSKAFSVSTLVTSLPLPLTQQALTVARKGEYELRDDHPLPEIQTDNEVLIKNYAVGLNPIDWKSVEYNFCLPSFPWVRKSSFYTRKHTDKG